MESGAVAVSGSGNDGGERVEAFFSGKNGAVSRRSKEKPASETQPSTRGRGAQRPASEGTLLRVDERKS